MQILIRFSDKETEQSALGKLIPRFSGKSWASGETSGAGSSLGFPGRAGNQVHGDWSLYKRLISRSMIRSSSCWNCFFHRLPPPGLGRRLPDSARKTGRRLPAKPARHLRRGRTCVAARPCRENGAAELAGPSPPPLSSGERSLSWQPCNIWRSFCHDIMESLVSANGLGLGAFEDVLIAWQHFNITPGRASQ